MINNENLFTKYFCNGSTEVFSVGIEYLKDGGNLKIVKQDLSNGVSVELVEGENYTIDTELDEISTEVDLDSPYPGNGEDTGYAILILLDVPYTQTTDIVSNSNYDPEVLESAYDKNTILAKQLKEEVNRTIKLSESDAGETLILPPVSELKGGVLGFDEEGNIITQQGFIPSLFSVNTQYETGEVVQYEGYFYRGLQPSKGNIPTGEPGVDLYWAMVAVGGLNYDPGFYYLLDDFCEYGGYLFKSAIASNRGNAPTTPDGDENWTRVTLSGDEYGINKWYAGTYYLNDLVTNGGYVWKATAASTTEEPTEIASDWEAYGVGGEESIPSWEAGTYANGKIVLHNKILWIVQAPVNTTEEPAKVSADWKYYESPEATTPPSDSPFVKYMMKTWTPVTSGTLSHEACIYVEKRLVSRVWTGSVGLNYSNNYGSTWAACTGITGGEILKGLCYSSDKGIALAGSPGANKIYASGDGIAWTTVETNFTVTSLCYARFLGLFVASGARGTSPGILTSPDATTWTFHPFSTGFGSPTQIVMSNELGIVVAYIQTDLGEDNLVYSYDCVTWYSTKDSALNGIVANTPPLYNPSSRRFCFLSATGVSYISYDGKVWEQAATTFIQPFQMIEVGGMFIAPDYADATGDVRISRDGVVWDVFPTVAGKWSGIAYCDKASKISLVSEPGMTNKVAYTTI